MLRSLHIQNIALITKLELEFSHGLTVLSGETGSGKSIIIDSLAFVLGERADKSMIKHGADKAYVEVCFDIDINGNTAKAMDEQGFEVDNTLIISRTLTLAGKNECRVNGRMCSTAMLKAITSTLVDIFGQSQHLNLLRADNHLSIVDGFADLSKLKSNLYDNYKLTKDIDRQLKQVGGTEEERARLLDILNFQITELTEANLSIEEEVELEQLHKKVVNTEKIATALSQSAYALSQGEPSITALCASAITALEQVANFDQSAGDLVERLRQAKIELQDIADSVREMQENTDYDANKVNAMEARLEKIRTIKRKYGGSVESALEFLAKAQKQYDELNNATETIDRLSKQRQSVTKQMYQIAEKISVIRQATAQKFEQDIMQQLSDLGMPSTTFKVQFEEKPSYEEYSMSPTSNGYDKAEFLISANKGQPLRPLAKVISGGEMSRFMLAVKNITATIENIPTMVFDEIDTGISGNIAQKVGLKLVAVSRQYQCIVITHLPQIVAIADTNIVISKHTDDNTTVSQVDVLATKQQRAEEVARLTGGTSKNSIANAMDMIEWAENYKANFAK